MDATESQKYLTWKSSPGRYEAFALGRLRFAIIREDKFGLWFLYRYHEHAGKIVMKSKERVHNLHHGRAYANQLARLSNLPRIA